jgi:hypothetical protein
MPSPNVQPTVARVLESKQLPTLKTLVLIGEVVNVGFVNRWNNNTTVINGHGPSEASIVAAMLSSFPPSSPNQSA